jgi:hypothetical protein
VLTTIAAVACPSCDLDTPILALALFERPEPGDLVVCLRCSEVCIVTDALVLRVLEVGDLEEYSLDDVARIVRAVTDYRASTERRN